MGNKREQLKEDISRELKRKIEAAQYLLDGLRIAQHDVKTDCDKAKHQFQTSMNELIATLNLRNIELANKIDSLCATQINSLQESIQATYVTLGSLQSTLANLDSFDNAQLLNLVIPDYEQPSEGIQVSLLDVNSGCSQLKDEINNWGQVCNKELSSIPMESSSAAPGTSAQVVPECDDDEFMVCKSGGKYGDDYDDEFDFILCGGDSKGCSTSDLAAAIERNLAIGSQVQAVPEVTPKPKSAMMPQRNEDLSAWLRPKRAHGTPAQVPVPEIVPQELAQKFPSFSRSCSISSSSSASSSGSATPPASKPAHAAPIATKRQYLDFPCLRLDPKCWLPNKRMKDAKTLGHILCSDVCFNLSQKEIIPPSYALPYPFWLKK